MSVKRHWVIPTGDLLVGTSLGFDLVDSDGQVLQKAGTAIDERFQTRLRERNIHSLTVRESAQPEPEDYQSILLSTYPEVTIRRIRASMDSARRSLLKMQNAINGNIDTHLQLVSKSVEEFVLQAKENIAATLAVIALPPESNSPEILERIANHSAKLALLSIVMSIAQKDDSKVSYQIGLAGLLHDFSLLLDCEWFSASLNRDETSRKKYRRHPIESADLLGLQGISKVVLSMITEVHEQADGSGYPRGLKLGRVKAGSEILNLVDAYLSMTNPIQGRPKVASDVLAYLCFHAAQGKFCTDTVQRLTESLSMYPIGSTVLLDDESKAIVVQGNRDKPMAPVVRLLHSGQLAIDLRKSNRFISGPFAKADKMADRISKSRIHEVLWKTDR